MAQMIQTKTSDNLEGQLLVAMPTLGDPRFDRSVILMCSHSADGAMGIVINKLVGNMRFSHLLDQLEIETTNLGADHPVHFGGPVDVGRGFVIHTNDCSITDHSLSVTPSIKLTASVDILQLMAEGNGPAKVILALGYAGWAPGQLEQEIQANSWLHCTATEHLVFNTKLEDKWSRALKSLGAEALTLSTQAGHA